MRCNQQRRSLFVITWAWRMHWTWWKQTWGKKISIHSATCVALQLQLIIIHPPSECFFHKSSASLLSFSCLFFNMHLHCIFFPLICSILLCFEFLCIPDNPHILVLQLFLLPSITTFSVGCRLPDWLIPLCAAGGLSALVFSLPQGDRVPQRPRAHIIPAVTPAWLHFYPVPWKSISTP